MRGPLLVPNQDVLEPGVLRQVLVDRQVGAARIAEYQFDSLALQRLQHYVRSSHLCSLQTRSPRLSVGGFAISLRLWLGRASPRLTKANEAQETKEEAYEHARRLVHVSEDVRSSHPGVVVGDAQFRGLRV